VPTELLARFPPPACTVPTELDALFPPDPAIVVGAETETDAPPTVPPADGVAVVFPTCTVPIEPVALLSARAPGAVIAAAMNVAATNITLDLIALLLPFGSEPQGHQRRPARRDRLAPNHSNEGCPGSLRNGRKHRPVLGPHWSSPIDPRLPLEERNGEHETAD
jgi:hypothetical protein